MQNDTVDCLDAEVATKEESNVTNSYLHDL